MLETNQQPKCFRRVYPQMAIEKIELFSYLLKSYQSVKFGCISDKGIQELLTSIPILSYNIKHKDEISIYMKMMFFSLMRIFFSKK